MKLYTRNLTGMSRSVRIVCCTHSGSGTEGSHSPYKSGDR